MLPNLQVAVASISHYQTERIKIRLLLLDEYFLTEISIRFSSTMNDNVG